MSVHDASRPAWLTALSLDYPGWRWLDAAQAAALSSTLHGRYQGRGSSRVPLKEEVVALCAMLLDRMDPVATVPIAPRRPQVVAHEATLWLDRARGERLIIAVHQEIPPLLWFPAGQTREALQQALSPYQHPTSKPDAQALTRTARGFIGSPGILDMEREELLARWSASPVAEPLFWGSAHDVDPWPAQIEADALPGLSALAADHMAQREGAPWAIHLRAIASRALLTFEDHDGLFTLGVRYAPADHGQLIQALNDQFSQRWPLDFPVDVCALLIGLHFEEATRQEELLAQARHLPLEEDEPETRAVIFDLYALASVMRHDLRLLDRLRDWALHPTRSVREAVADIAARHGYDALLLELAADESDEALRVAILGYV